MGSRRQAREAAFQLIYQVDLSGLSYIQASDEFLSQMGVSHKAREFAMELVKGVMDNLEKIDALISENSLHWKLNRMSSVDKSILRMGVYELAYQNETPKKVIINEAIEIGKKFGTAETGSFINGILDKIAKEVRKSGEE